jgi:hypothetical protein
MKLEGRPRRERDATLADGRAATSLGRAAFGAGTRRNKREGPEMKSHRFHATFVAAALVATTMLVVAGCGGSNQATAVSNLCSSLGSYSAALTELQGLTSQNTLADVQAATANVKKAHAQVVVDAKKVKAANMATINSAQLSLQAAAKTIPASTTVEAALTQLQPQLQALEQAYSQVYTSMTCS